MKRVIIMSLCTVAWVCTIIFGIVPTTQHTDSVYTGRDIFWSEQEYETFKQDVQGRVFADNLKVNNFDIIASEPPITVSFSITVPHDYAFPYGKSNTHNLDVFLIILISLVAGMLLLGFPASLMFDWRIERS